jgi:hypothetical protein
MDFWATSESSTDVSQDYFSNLEKEGAINALIKAVNRHLSKIETGDWRKWRVIFMISSDEHQAAFGMRETRRLTRSDMTLDFRVFVDYQASKSADFDKCIDLLIPALERTLPYFSRAKIGKAVQEEIRRLIRIAAEETKAAHSSKH